MLCKKMHGRGPGDGRGVCGGVGDVLVFNNSCAPSPVALQMLSFFNFYIPLGTQKSDAKMALPIAKGLNPQV